MSADPVTMLAIASVASTAIGGVATMAGQAQASSAAQGQAAYQAGVLRNNKILADRAAQDALDRGKVAEDRQRIQTRQLAGRQRAVLAANGVLVDSGSALDITSDTAMIGELDALTIRANAEREAEGFRQQGANFSSEADLADARGRQAKSSLPLQIGGTLLSTTGSVASKWYGFNQDGIDLLGSQPNNAGTAINSSFINTARF